MRSSTGRSWTTAGSASTRRSSRARCTAPGRTASAPRPRDVRVRRGREPADGQLLRLPRAARARPPEGEDGLHRVSVALLAARDEGDGGGRRRRHPRRVRGDPERAPPVGKPIVYDSHNPYHRVWELIPGPRRAGSSWRWSQMKLEGDSLVLGSARHRVGGAQQPGADGRAHARRRVVRRPGRPPLEGEREDPARPRRHAHVDQLREARGARARLLAAAREGHRRRRAHGHDDVLPARRGRRRRHRYAVGCGRANRRAGRLDGPARAAADRQPAGAGRPDALDKQVQKAAGSGEAARVTR